MDFFNDHSISLKNLVGIGCDGTAVNTEEHRGIIRQFEVFLGRPIQRLICMMHLNELPLHHLFVNLDGKLSDLKVFRVK